MSTPVDAPVTVLPAMVAWLLLTLHTPPPVASVKVTLLPIHKFDEAGEIAAGLEITFTAFRAEQPSVLVKEIVAVPTPVPVTTPEEFTVAVPMVPLLQVPGLLASVREVVVPIQTLTTPDGVMEEGLALMVTTAVTVQVPKV